MINKISKENKYPTAYWSEYASRMIADLGLKKTAQDEYHGPCPNCSGVDRFWIKQFNGEVVVNCRKCNDFGAIKDKLKSIGLWPSMTTEYNLSRPDVPLSDIDWPSEAEANDVTHPYLQRKKVKQHNAKIDGPDLSIPIIDPTGKRVGMQFIDEVGNKKFTYQMPVVGNFSVIGGPIKDFAYICEGWATAASVHEATNKPAVFALNAGNIPAVCGALQKAKPNAELIIAADNDEAGQKACEKAFEQYGIEHIMPEREGNDWNDVWIARGPEATRKLLQPQNIMDEVFFPSDAIPQLSNNYLIKGWLGQGQMSVLYGGSNGGKSFCMLDMAYHVAANQPWNGHKVDGGPVLYLATEGGMAFHNRVVALRNKYPEYGDNIPLAVRPSPVNLLDPEADLAKIAKLCDAITKRHGPIKLIVVDTLSRSMAGGNENAPEDMTKLIKNCDVLREMTGAHVNIVHHSGKDKAAGARGHSSLRAATDTEIELDHDEESGIRTATATKQRDMETGAKFPFVLAVEDLGVDQDGDPVTTCTVSKASDSDIEEAQRPKISGKNQRTIQWAFDQLRGEGIGSPNPAGVGWPEPRQFWVIDVERVREHFEGKMSGVANPRSAWKQALEKLQENGNVCVNDGHMWFTNRAGKVRNDA